MARQLRLEFAGALYHLTARGNAREDIFRDDEDRQTFLRLLGKEVEQQGWRCYAYCLMDNHYHLLVETPEPNLSRGMRRLNQVYTQAYNRRHGRVGHVLQGRYKSILVHKDSYLQELCRYIVLNPVRARMVSSAKDWPWSSYRATAGLKTAPAWLDINPVLDLFARRRAAACGAYRQFVREGHGSISPWTQVCGQIFLGDEAFLERMERLIRKQRLTNVPQAQARPVRSRQEDVLRHVCEVYGVSANEILSRANPEAYHAAVWLLRRAANLPLGTVAALFDVSPSRISHIQRAVETVPPSQNQQQVMRLCKVKQ
ncbi:MAG: hypothetical protein FD165_1698 [Gammaproteobacteria bacterium]|nr:MAG: hypothetical protein FD165_1698 [Gammaproteobacteria bacterium]TND02654.1 MAG: hypothetical protein FD120_2115 [Gammaproteobacteria bacterium]